MGESATAVVSAVLRHEGDVLVLKRSDAVGTYPGAWGVISGYAEGAPDSQVHHEIAEESGLEGAVALVRTGRPVTVEDEAIDRTWSVHPYLFDADTRSISLSEEHTEAEWIDPSTLARGDRETVPALWETYQRVAPTVRTIAADADHGAAYLSLRALEVLRDRAAVLCADGTPDDRDELVGLAERLIEVRPAMTVLNNRVTRAMSEATPEEDARGVLEATRLVHAGAIDADREAATLAAEQLEGSVMTISRSGTVLASLRRSGLERIYVAESRPDREGSAVAEELADVGPVTLHTDAAAAHLLATEEIDAVVVGADTILPSGSVINKAGTRAIALAATHEGVPIIVVAASDKVATDGSVNLESGDRQAVYTGDASIDVVNPTFDVTPATCIDGIVTEHGRLAPDEVASIADEHRARTDWR